MSDGFEGAITEITGTPPLGPRQAELVDALTERIRSGPPMSPADGEVSAWLSAVLGVPILQP